MSQPKTKRTSWVGWIISALLIIASVWLWTERQNVVDAIQYHQYTPTPGVREVAASARLTDDALFTFYASHPSVESSDSFNKNCQRREADSPILGCYAGNRIYIFDVTDDRLEGIKVVTAAHELLHAEYDRLPETEKKRIQTLLEKVYKSGTDSKLEARMAYYEKTEPGQEYNELHSIIGTEFESIGTELEAHYAKYFSDRGALVTLHRQVEAQFDALSQEADALVAKIETLAESINVDTARYNQQTEELNQSVETFNQRASRTGGFTSQAEFQASRQDLLNKSSALAAFRQRIQSDIAEYKTQLSRLESINAESASLNQSLDSTLSDAPQI